MIALKIIEKMIYWLFMIMIYNGLSAVADWQAVFLVAPDGERRK